MTSRQREAIANLPRLVAYFERIAQDTKWHMWETEHEVASATVSLISIKTVFTEGDFKAIALCVNKIVGQEHSNGSGWLDFEAHVSIFFAAYGYNSEWNNSTGEFTFWKKRSGFWRQFLTE